MKRPKTADPLIDASTDNKTDKAFARPLPTAQSLTTS
jgi:hypothetical protein